MSFDYFYGQQSDLFTFYRVPKVLFTNERFWNISADAKMLYGILLDRMSLSAKNGWIDKNGRVYIIFTIDEAKMALNCAEQKAIKLLSELEKKAGLIERKRQGLGKPNLIYVKNFISAVDSQLLNCENHNSGTMEITTQELPKSQCNNTDIKNTEFSDTDSIFPSGNGGMMDENDRYQEYFDYFSDQLSMDLLKKDYPYDSEMLDNILELIVETVCTKRPLIRIGAEERPAEIVRSRFMKLNVEHITQAAGKGRLLSCQRRHDMNQMEIFKNPEFGSIRVIEENGKYLFCGTDVAAALGYSNSRDAIIRHCRYVVKRDAPHPQSPDRKISMTFIPEGDLYRLIVHSKLPSAEQFEQWVFDEVLPTIRKHGAYLTREKLWEVATSPEALMKLCSDLLAEREANISLRKENAQLEGKAAFYDLFIDLKHSTNLRTTAKELDVPERRFVRFLIERRFVYRTASGNVLPYANVKNTGLFCVKDYCNHGHTGSYTLVTPKGKLYFAQLREMILLVS